MLSFIRYTAFTLTICCLGCGSRQEGPATVTVKGTVSYDGKPLQDGEIIFRRADGDQKGFGGRIENGRYTIAAEPGKMAVLITSRREVPGKFHTTNGVPEPVIEMYIPKKYNSETSLSVDVQPGQSSPVDFDLPLK